MTEAVIEKISKHVEKKRAAYVNILREAVAIPSVKGRLNEAVAVLRWAESKLKDLGGLCSLFDVGSGYANGSKTKSPPILVATIRSSSSKPTLLVYGHLDVGPVYSGGSNSNSGAGDYFTMIESQGALFGKGVTDGKGPLLCWFNAVDAYRSLGLELPVNLKFIIEAMKQSGSCGLMQYLSANKATLFQGVKYVCVPDSSCMDGATPVITYGLRGCCKFSVTVTCAELNLHSGVHGGTVPEAMTDVVYLMNSLVSPKGDVLIPNIRDGMVPVTPAEEKEFKEMTFDPVSYKKTIKCFALLHKGDKKRLLMHRTRFPSLTLHCIETNSSADDDDAIPGTVTANFTIRIVPHQSPEKVQQIVTQHLKSVFAETKSKNKLDVEMTLGTSPWLGDTRSQNFQAAYKAVRSVMHRPPEFFREGSSIPIISTLQELSGINVVLLPVGYSNHCVQTNREKMDVRVFMDGTKIVAAYMYELLLSK